MSTSTIKEKIETGDLDGWDDPRAPTLKSLKRRGIRGEAVTDALADLGTSTSNVDLSMSAIYSNNRELIDEETDRAFFVRDSHESDDDIGPAVEKPIIGGPEMGEPPVHPNHEDRGTREIPVEGAVLIEAADVPANGQRVWLKGYGCVKHTRDAFEFTGDDIDVVREGDVEVVQWVPADTAVPTRMRTMDGDVTGYAEPGVAEYDPDDLLQFVRVGFVRIDQHSDDETVTYYTHD